MLYHWLDAIADVGLLLAWVASLYLAGWFTVAMACRVAKHFTWEIFG